MTRNTVSVPPDTKAVLDTYDRMAPYYDQDTTAAVVERQCQVPQSRCPPRRVDERRPLGPDLRLTATALGLGPFQIAAFHNSAAEELLDIDGITELPAYLLAAGIPADGSLSPTVTLTAFRHTTL